MPAPWHSTALQVVRICISFCGDAQCCLRLFCMRPEGGCQLSPRVWGTSWCRMQCAALIVMFDTVALCHDQRKLPLWLNPKYDT